MLTTKASIADINENTQWLLAQAALPDAIGSAGLTRTRT
jgi:hypothetical protein